jgi:hypothetical protein
VQARFAERGRGRGQRVNFDIQAIRVAPGTMRNRGTGATQAARKPRVRALADAIQLQWSAVRRSVLAALARRCYTPTCFQTRVFPT